MKRLSHKQFRSLLALAAIMVLLAVSLTGCFGKDTTDPSDASGSPEPSETSGLVEATEAPTEPEPTETEPPTVMGTVNTDKLNVRTEADPSSPSVQKLAVGTRLEILEQKVVDDVTWGRTTDGWVNMKYVTLDGDLSTTTDPSGESTDPTSAPEETTGSSETSEGTTGTITAKSLNVRSGPGTKYKTTGSVKKGDKVTIYEKSGNWGRTKDGWISLKYVKLDGDVAESTTTPTTTTTENTTTGTSTSKVGIITASELNIRSTAGTDGKKAGAYEFGDQVKITEETTVDGTKWGKTSKGWISLKYVYIQGEKGDKAGTGTVTADKLNVRSGPGTDYKKITQVTSGDKLEILTQITIGKETWGYTSDGWVNMEYVKVS